MQECIDTPPRLRCAEEATVLKIRPPFPGLGLSQAKIIHVISSTARSNRLVT